MSGPLLLVGTPQAESLRSFHVFSDGSADPEPDGRALTRAAWAFCVFADTDSGCHYVGHAAFQTTNLDPQHHVGEVLEDPFRPLIWIPNIMLERCLKTLSRQSFLHSCGRLSGLQIPGIGSRFLFSLPMIVSLQEVELLVIPYHRDMQMAPSLPMRPSLRPLS